LADFRQGLHRSLHEAGSISVGPHPEDVASLVLQEIGDMIKDGGDLSVGHGSYYWERVGSAAVG